MNKSLKVVLRVTDRCNQDCLYCYVDRETRRSSSEVMSHEMLRNFYERFLDGAFQHVHIVWHGGEPTIVGRDYLERALDLQKQFTGTGVEIENSIQTNATAIDESTAKLLFERNVAVGISLDAPPDIQDRLRVNWSGRSTLPIVLQKIEMMHKVGLRFGAICVLNRFNYQRTDEIYRFFKDLGLNYQFNPFYRDEATPASITELLAITPEQYAEALIKTFDLYVQDDNPTIEVSDLKEIILSMFVGCGRSCLFAGQCEEYIGALPNGDVYLCDIFFRDEFRIGHLSSLTPEQFFGSSVVRSIVSRPQRLQGTYCKGCEWWSICRGGCSSKSVAVYGDAFREDPFCETRKELFAHIRETLANLEGKEVKIIAKTEETGTRFGAVCSR